jgi:hypothetical protein
MYPSMVVGGASSKSLGRRTRPPKATGRRCPEATGGRRSDNPLASAKLWLLPVCCRRPVPVVSACAGDGFLKDDLGGETASARDDLAAIRAMN